MFGLHRFKLRRHLVDGTVRSVSGLGRFSVYSGFGLDRFHCIMVRVVVSSAVVHGFEP